MLRLAGGDWIAIAVPAGSAVGVFIGVQFIEGGYNLGRYYPAYKFTGLIIPLMMVGLLLLLIIRPTVPSGTPFFSAKGPDLNTRP